MIDAWLLWMVTACVLGVAEMLTLGLFFAPFAVAALVAATLSTVAGFYPSLAVSAAASLLLLSTVRPLVMGRLRSPVGVRNGEVWT